MIHQTRLRRTADPFEPPPGAYHATARDGEAFIWQVAPNVVLKKAGGVLSEPLIQCYVDFFTPILNPGAGIQVFGDFAGITDYTAEARQLATAFTTEHRSAVERIHLLGASKYLALAFGCYEREAGADLVFVYSARESFLHSLAQALNEPHGRQEAALNWR
jgi:hypothetical protein